MTCSAASFKNIFQIYPLVQKYCWYRFQQFFRDHHQHDGCHRERWLNKGVVRNFVFFVFSMLVLMFRECFCRRSLTADTGWKGNSSSHGIQKHPPYRVENLDAWLYHVREAHPGTRACHSLHVVESSTSERALTKTTYKKNKE